MICPNCDTPDMDVKPFGEKGARACRCSNPACKTYFVLPKSKTSPKEATHVTPPQPAPKKDDTERATDIARNNWLKDDFGIDL